MSAPGPSYKEASAEAPPPERLVVDRYDGPKSFHASRAFAEWTERKKKRDRKAKLALVAAVLVLGGALAWAAAQHWG